MKTQIGASNQSVIAKSIPHGPIGVFYGEQTGTAGRINGETGSMYSKPIRDSIGKHGTTASGNSKTVDLKEVIKNCITVIVSDFFFFLEDTKYDYTCNFS